MKRERNIFAVCDLEVEYAYHFMEYLSRKRNIPFEVRVFTSIQTLLEFVRQHSVELLLISEKAMNEEIQKEKIGQILILSEGVVPENTEKEENLRKADYPNIYKYQSTNQVLREAMAYYGELQETEPPLYMGKRKVDVVGIYSPVGRTMKTTFALTLGQLLAKKKAVLYINLETYSGFEYLLGQTYEQTMSDLLYYLRQNTVNITMKMSGMVQNIHNLDYLPPVSAPGDIQNTEADEWIRLLQQIVDYSTYEVVILDMGDGVRELPRLLEQCTKIYMPIQTDPIAQAKLQQFENFLKLWNGDTILEKIQKISLPYHRTKKSGIGCMDDLVWSEFGDCVREMVRTEWTEKN